MGPNCENWISAEIEGQEMALVAEVKGGHGLHQVPAQVHHLQLHQVHQALHRDIPTQGGLQLMLIKLKFEI